MHKISILIMSVVFLWSCQPKPTADISGELKQWHKISLTFEGPQVSELDSVNPFLNYRLNVTFSNKEKEYVVPGFFAADGNAANTSATSGNKWRVHFAPDDTGRWEYEVSFRKGENVAVSLEPEAGEDAGFFNGLSGSFNIEPTDKAADDLRSKGRLKYVNKRYLQFADSKEYFVKAGADAPENLLAYEDFDATPNAKGLRKSWEPHLKDFQEEAAPYLWGENQDKGKELLGAINYLASKGMNVFSFLTYNVDGDDRNVFPYILKEDMKVYETYASEGKNRDAWNRFFYKYRFNVSKLAQWEKVFEYGGLKGMYLHFKTLEQEVDQNFDGGDLGLQRKLYYRELIARFSHHLALNWNLGEENTQTTEQLQDALSYIKSLDPYDHLRVFHTYPNRDEMYRPFLGQDSDLTGLSMQLSDSAFRDVHARVQKWVHLSDSAGKAWVIAVDEPGDATHAVVTDEENPEHDNARINALWGTLMAGGAGVEWYFGYRHPESDLTLQNWRSRSNLWDQSRYALQFFQQIPFEEMTPDDAFTDAEDDYCLIKPGEKYVIYQKSGKAVQVNLESGNYQVRWYNPRSGEFEGDQLEVQGGEEQVNIPAPSDEEDWVILIENKETV